MMRALVLLLFTSQLHAAPTPLRMSWGYHGKNTISLQQEKIGKYKVWTMAYWEGGPTQPRFLAKRVLTEEYAADFRARIEALTPLFPETMALVCQNAWTLELEKPRKTKYVCLDVAGQPFHDKFSALVKSSRILLHLE